VSCYIPAAETSIVQFLVWFRRDFGAAQSPCPASDARSPSLRRTVKACARRPFLAHTYSDLRLITGQAIRLIVLLSAKFADPICCTIATVDPYKEQYDAVSYTWATEDGEYSKTGRIHCPDGVIPVTENCEAALRRLRLPSAPRQLWVDAVCIDQTNIKERNHQVGLMDVIFRLASAVHICIQDPRHDYTGLVNILKSDAFHCPESIAVSQAAELIRRRYFSRVWVENTTPVVVHQIANISSVCIYFGHHRPMVSVSTFVF
jgi:hypothetical protein